MNAIVSRWPWKKKLVRWTSNVPIDPVKDIERTVSAKCKDVVCRDGLCFAHALEEKHLRQDSNGLKENAERPQEFKHR